LLQILSNEKSNKNAETRLYSSESIQGVLDISLEN